MKVHDIMQHNAHFLRKDDTLREAAALFRGSGVGGAQVLGDSGYPETIFTSDDLIRALAGGANLSDPVSHHAHRHICAVQPDTPVDEIAWYENRFLAVVDSLSRIMGCVDASRLLPELAPGLADGTEPWSRALARFPEPLLLCDHKGAIGWANDAAKLVLGAAARRGAGLRQALAGAGFDVEDDPVEPEAVALAVRDDSRYVTLRWQVPDPFSQSAEPCRMVWLRDVNDRHAVLGKLRGLRDLSRELRSIIDSSFDGIFITDGEGVTLQINRAYERITGIRAEEVVGRSMRELVREGFYDQSVTLLVLESLKTETIIQKVKRGKTIVVTGNPILDEKGKLWRVVTNVRDVTELQRLQEELEKMSALHERYRMELDSLRKSIGQGGRIVVRSKRMRDVYEQALRLAQVDSTVLILGESGVGKEVVASIIHEHSPRNDKPFVKISCAAIPEALLESELFGYVQGAFTGACRAGKPGVFELAHQGTLFLDEIGELPLGLQAKLLRVLQERKVLRLGEVRPTDVDVRIMAASNRDLETMMRHGLFRSDLYYRLSVVPVVVPPLRERREAIFDFIYRFLGSFNRKYGLSRQIDPEACDYLAACSWPGNVRQLENTMERLVVLCQGDVITREAATRALVTAKGGDDAENTIETGLRGILETAEREAIRQALTTHGSTRKAARALKVNQSTIVRKAHRYGLSEA
ncbi:PAS modulated sigma54 specific transcriptional regulator, Fis family [Solidesulfovibrio fructosivorans JJ]]|uniref:HTH-type transcriptional regulatory protein TyrR n=1 Tax=Solidesulfovibrio fructosivorans JJ] TaxID=596151 RepID=E1K2H3_SOLFR|nr:sigma-54-dependent Fis family transcriptional regulator [Solidesulfovibrio fructosivorans]EFL49191.1 PAS modulated sigma54 specific transcriptional regulator, Fis family [Solidesulfovibrio fructosivorans JJ]]